MPVNAQGVDSQRYCVTPRTLIFAVQVGKVLLVKGSPTKRLWANLLNGIGGHIQPGEDVISSARREFQEETGLVSHRMFLCGVLVVDTGQQPGIAIYVIRAEDISGQLVSSIEGDVSWFPVNEALYKLPLVEDLPHLLPRVLDYHPGDAPFSGLYWYAANGELHMTFAD
jgi:8-oxo-dGTP diphosphatase